MLYVVRHGEVEWNKENKVCGLTDQPLTEKGLLQAQQLADKLENKKIDIIISSPLQRAYQTAKAVADRFGLEIIKDERLIEQNYGIYEGVDRFNENFLANKRMFAYKYPGGESMMQVAHRTYSLIEEVKEKNKGKNVLFACHGGICRVINTYFTDVTNDEFFCYSPENCAVLEYEL